MTALIQMIPEGHYSPIDLDRFLAELEVRFKQKEVMHTKEAAAFLGISVSKLYRMKTVPFHTIPELEGRIYLKSELIDFIKRH